MRPQCPSCDSFNEPEALHCNQCGQPMEGIGQHSKNAAGRWSWLPWTLPLGVAAWLWLPALVDDESEAPPVIPPAEPKLKQDPARPRFQSPETDPDPALLEFDEPQETLGVNTGGRARWGWLQMEDPAGLSLGVTAGAISAEGWVALPRKDLLGATEIVFRQGRPGSGLIRSGFYRIGDPVGLWKVEPADSAASLPLAAYDPEMQTWGIEPDGTTREWLPQSGWKVVGSFLHIPEPVSTAEVLVQEGAVVGWLLPDERSGESAGGSGLAGAWLWNGPRGDELSEIATLADFQQSEFAGGVVEGYRQIFDTDLEDLPALSLLDIARIRPLRLTEEEIPLIYDRDALLANVRDRLSNGLGTDPLNYFWGISTDSLRWLQDPLTTRVWMALALESGDIDSLRVAIDTTSNLVFENAQPQALKDLEDLLAELWISGIEAYRKAGDQGLAHQWIEQGRIRYPGNDTLRLLDGERLLDSGELAAAEVALEPPVLKADLIPFRDSLLKRLKAERSIEGRILVRFTPGSPVIEATAKVGNLPVDFLVDTGATSTTIPHSVIQQLGITLDGRTQQRRIRTASDEFMAPVVELPAINLDGAVVSGIQATVLDLPGQPGVGLLGLDFLSNFRLDIDIERGWLLLEPR